MGADSEDRNELETLWSRDYYTPTFRWENWAPKMLPVSWATQLLGSRIGINPRPSEAVLFH